MTAPVAHARRLWMGGLRLLRRHCCPFGPTAQVLTWHGWDPSGDGGGIGRAQHRYALTVWLCEEREEG